MIREANSAYRLPASVRLIVRAVRLTRCTPRERSSSATCLDTSEPEMPSCRAAWLKLRAFVTPTKLRMIVSWSMSLLDHEDASDCRPLPRWCARYPGDGHPRGVQA